MVIGRVGNFALARGGQGQADHKRGGADGFPDHGALPFSGYSTPSHRSSAMPKSS
jgi:hypothetical protein